MQVNPVVEVDAVDLTTGNINFEGSLQVRGDISATMEVRVTGDVVVNGTMEAALVEAGGNVTVKGGIIGMAEAMQDASGPARTAHIVCGGELKARFIENAIISAGQNVEVEREIRQCSIAAGGAVNVGAANAQQTAIMGGQIRALQAVRAGTIGSPAGVPTLVQAGLDPHADIKRTALTRKRVKMNEEKAKLEQLLLFLHSHPERATGDVVDRARNTHAKLGRDLVSLEEEEAQLVRDLQPIHSQHHGQPALLQRREDPDRQQDAGIPGRPGWRQGRAGSRRDRHPLNPARAGDADRSAPRSPPAAQSGDLVVVAGRSWRSGAVRAALARRQLAEPRAREIPDPAPAPKSRRPPGYPPRHPRRRVRAGEAHRRRDLSPDPTRPSGWKCAPTASAAAREPPASCSTEGDQVQAGDTASTRTPAGASSTAKFLVICSKAALDAG